jgi:hypothetical protein
MWMGHDLAWWGFVVAVASLLVAVAGVLLTFPIAILTPMLQNWWAERSLAPLGARLLKLEAQLADLEANYTPISIAEDLILNGIGFLGAIASFGVTIVPLIMVLVARERQPGHFPVSILLVVVLGMFCNATSYIGWKVLGEIDGYRRLRSPRRRERLKICIAKLRAELKSELSTRMIAHLQ